MPPSIKRYGWTKCPNCGVEFERRKPNQIYDCAGCAWQAWDKANPRLRRNKSGTAHVVMDTGRPQPQPKKSV